MLGIFHRLVLYLQVFVFRLEIMKVENSKINAIIPTINPYQYIRQEVSEMFDVESDMFKPLIGARLIREEAKEQADLVQDSKRSAEEGQTLETDVATADSGVGAETATPVLNGGGSGE